MSDCLLFDEFQRQTMRRRAGTSSTAPAASKSTPLFFNVRLVASRSATARRAAQKRGEGPTARPGSRRAISAGPSTVMRSPRAPTVNRPGSSSAALSVMGSRKPRCSTGSGADITTSITRKAPLG